jgi:hypothetical protein
MLFADKAIDTNATHGLAAVKSLRPQSSRKSAILLQVKRMLTKRGGLHGAGS